MTDNLVFSKQQDGPVVAGGAVDNDNGGDVTVFNGPLTRSSSGTGTPNRFGIVIDVNNKFYYDPALGHLIAKAAGGEAMPLAITDSA